jgi:hypothetical protein
MREIEDHFDCRQQFRFVLPAPGDHLVDELLVFGIRHPAPGRFLTIETDEDGFEEGGLPCAVLSPIRMSSAWQNPRSGPE